jgi:undecaprenyl pyrophosphate phosphatase UppP
MAKTGILYTLGKLLGAISGVLALVWAILGLLDNDAMDDYQVGAEILTDTVGYVVAIVVAVLCIAVCIDRYKIKDTVVLGIVVLVLGLLGAGFLATLGGILIILDAVL